MKGASADDLDYSALDHLVGFLIATTDVPARRAFQLHVGLPMKLRPVEFSLLLLLMKNPDLSPKHLAQALKLPAPNITVLVDRLVERDVVERRRSPTDGRAMQLRLTEKGQALAAKAQRISLTMEDKLLHKLSPGERVMLRELLVKISRSP